MDERIWTIAEILDQSGPMTADELAAQLKLSGKTVRSLIKTYAKEMQENGFCITAKPGRGFGIEITDAQTYVSGSKPQQGEQTGIPQDAQERIQRLRQYLLEKDGYSKLDDLSEQFFVSRRSISNDLREVERQLAEYGLSIRRKPGYGICVVGRETNRRICIAAQRDESRPVGQQIQELVSRVLEKEKFAMSTMALDNLAVHLEVAVERIRTGHAIESSDGMQADLPERILEVASHIAVQIENMTGVAFPLPEVCYIAMHLNGKQKPMFIAENGLGTADTIDPDGRIRDTARMEYLKKHIEALQQAVADGCDIFGYTWWGPIDIVSAGTGEMEKRYGFIYVDKDNQGNGTLQRRKKDSFEYYKKVIASNGQDLELPAED